MTALLDPMEGRFVQSPSVKGWCPGALKPMRSGDGLVVRLRLEGPVLRSSLARAIAGLAQTHGNGQIDLTQRANLQIRGVSDATWPDLIERLAALGVIDPDAETEAVRNIIVSPLAGLDPSAEIDGLALARALQERLTSDPLFLQLPGKFGFVVDDGGAVPLDGVGADVRFVGVDGRIAVEIGDCWRIAVVDQSDMGDAAAGLVRAFLDLRGGGPDMPRRMAAVITRVGAAVVAEMAGFAAVDVGRRPRRPELEILGRRTLASSGFFGIGIPFGRLSADTLAVLGESAERDGTGDLRLTPWRTILIPGFAKADDPSDLIAAGLITSPADPRRSVAACPGAPECDSGAGAVRDDALALAGLAAQIPGDGIKLHVSGCAKGCARPQSTPLTLIAGQNGYGLVRNGRAGDGPISTGLTRQAIEGVLRTLIPEKQVSDRVSYIRDGAEIYRHSFAIIRREADLARFTPDEEPVAVRIVHACGMVEITSDLAFAPGAAAIARAALRAGAPIFTDAEMVARGVTRARLPADNDVICTLTDQRVVAMAAAAGTTRSAAAMDLWRDRLGGSIVAIGNAPTSLYRLLEMLDEGAAIPACVIGMPVGFVGAAESKEALILDGRVPYIVVRGRKGGSAMAAAAVNALASDRE